MITRLIAVTIAMVTMLGGTASIAQPAAGSSLDIAKDAGNLSTSVQNALESLLERQQRGGGLLIDQGDLDPLIHKGGGGACPSAAAVIAYQAMRVVAGLESDQRPHKVALAAFASDPTLLHGRLTNSQFTKLLRYYGSLLEGATIEVETISAPNSPHAVDGNTWGIGEQPDLIDRSDVIRILAYTVIRDSGEVLGRHFVLQRSLSDGVLRVVDPTALLKERHYTIESDLEGLGRVFLRFPTGKAIPRTNELNTVFEVKVQPPVAAGRYTPTESSPVARIKKEVDMLAAQLSAKGKLRSPREWRRLASHFGLPSLDLPAEFGGANWPARKMLEVFRHAGTHDLNLRDVVGAAHGRVLLRSTVPEVRDVVQRVTDGVAYLAIAITEPTAGSDYTAMKSTCVKVDGGYRLNGVKRFNARLDQATHVIVFTQSDSGKPGRLNVFLLPIDTEGLIIERFEAHGLTGNSYGGLVMKDVFVPETHRIGGTDDGYHIFNDHFRYWRLMQVAAALGTAEGALDKMAERLKTRNVSGGPIGRFTHLQQPLAEYTIKLKMANALARKAARLLDQGNYDEADILICGLKSEGIEIALEAVDSAVRAFGGEGYSDLVDLGDRLRDLNGLRIADGTTDAVRSAVVAKGNGKVFWEMAIERSGSSE